MSTLTILVGLLAALVCPLAQAQTFGGKKPGDPLVEFLNEVNIEYDRGGSTVVCASVHEPCHYRITYQPKPESKDSPVILHAWADMLVYHTDTQNATTTGHIKVDTGEYVLLTEYAELVRSASMVIMPSEVTWIQKLPQDRFNILKGDRVEIKFNDKGVLNLKMRDTHESKVYITKNQATQLLHERE